VGIIDSATFFWGNLFCRFARIPARTRGFRIGFVLRQRPPKPASDIRKSWTPCATKPDPLIYQRFRKLVRFVILYFCKKPSIAEQASVSRLGPSASDIRDCPLHTATLPLGCGSDLLIYQHFRKLVRFAISPKSTAGRRAPRAGDAD
jgi:hypothetical protein